MMRNAPLVILVITFACILALAGLGWIEHKMKHRGDK